MRLESRAPRVAWRGVTCGALVPRYAASRPMVFAGGVSRSGRLSGLRVLQARYWGLSGWVGGGCHARGICWGGSWRLRWLRVLEALMGEESGGLIFT